MISLDQVDPRSTPLRESIFAEFVTGKYGDGIPDDWTVGNFLDWASTDQAAGIGAFEDAIKEAVTKLAIRDEARKRYESELNPNPGRVLTWEELEDMGSKPALVDGLLFLNTVALLVSKRNVGKSMLAFALAGAVATGSPFLGRTVTQGNVVLVLGEGAPGAARRFNSLCRAYGYDMDEIRSRVSIVVDINLSAAAGVQSVREAVSAAEPVLVVFDTWSSLSGVRDENDQAETARVLREIQAIAPGAARLILHHPNSETENTTAPRSRGGSTLPSNVDTVLTLWRDKAHTDPTVHGSPEFMALSTEDEHAGKQKEAERETIRGLYLNSHAEERSAYLAWSDGTLTFDERWVRREMKLGETVTVADLVERTDESRTTIQRHLANAEKYVTATASPGKATTYTRVK